MLLDSTDVCLQFLTTKIHQLIVGTVNPAERRIERVKT